MTIDAEARPYQPTFPGLGSQSSGLVSGLEAAALTTIEALDRQHLLGPEHTLTVQLVVELARAVAAGVRSGRASAVALAAKELREALATLPEPVVKANDEWLAFVSSLSGVCGCPTCTAHRTSPLGD